MREGVVPAGLSDVLLATRRDPDARAMPVRQLVALANGLADGTGLVIDFALASRLGYPLVVLRLPAQRHSVRFDALTPREREVAACIAAGLPNREIAVRLWLSTATVKDHVHRILSKTGLRNRTAMASMWNCDNSFKPELIQVSSTLQ